MKHALVTLSGGQDSATCLGWALKNADRVSAVSFFYGQRHAVELDCAAALCEKHNVARQVVDISFFGELVQSALTGPGSVSDPHAALPNVPASFVPNRNAMLLLLAHTVAQTLGADTIVGGQCQTDFSGYPDCRENFVHNAVGVFNLGCNTDIKIVTPLMHLDKAQTWELADRVGFLCDVLDRTHTCYNGDHKTRHSWGFGCGVCPACQLRAKGFYRWQNKDFDLTPFSDSLRFAAARDADLPCPAPLRTNHGNPIS